LSSSAEEINRVIGPLGHVINIRLATLGASQKAVFFVANFNPNDLTVLKDMFETGQVKPVVEQAYPLHEISKAMHHLGTGHAKRNRR
jgi:D-arabinose 1-dehydrogenase-like Zn-dependent alcohol dehydrogenase